LASIREGGIGDGVVGVWIMPLMFAPETDFS